MWHRYHWHTVCLAVFLVITTSDFLIMPWWTEYYNHALTPEKMVDLATKFSGASEQISALQQLHAARDWQPITLSQSGMFYVAYGAILGVGAWTRIKDIRQANRLQAAKKKPNVPSARPASGH